MADKGVYKDGKFECQDFSLALLAFLHRRFNEFGNIYGVLVWKDMGIHWQCPVFDSSGRLTDYKKHTHAIGIVQVPGVPASPGPPPTPAVPEKFSIFDPQSGRMLEISPECGHDTKCIAEKAMELLQTNYDTCIGSQYEHVSPARPHQPDGSNLPNGYVPWWKCKDAPPDDANCPNDPEVNPWVRFKKYLSECCDGTAPACGTLTAPTTCNPDWYIWN